MLAAPNGTQVVENLMGGVPRGSLWSSNWMPEAVSTEHGSELRKKYRKCHPNGRPGVNLGGHFGRLEPPWGRFGRHVGVPTCYFSRYANETCVFAISMPV